ncbi:MAG: pyruvate ferredoxin oxidoreductase [Candidatus Heimdallarchaeota archaeon]|nr:pyruvate ferredoxin oxidoreductase [Candidatus Heimdallarchaeota archaeon]MCK4770592.1 pyruvate ferredoxin oxidoreductase [Candidatus Heimdallarchaeota archaeon]
MLEIPSISVKDLQEWSKMDEVLTSGHRLCAGCGAGSMARQVTLAAKALGKPIMLVNATGCLEVASTIYPYTAWNAPWVHNAFENAAATASGAIEAMKAMRRKKQMSAKDAHMIVFGGDGGTYDIGLQSLSGAIERGHDFLYVCYNNGAYMNTGIQRSGGTPKYAATTTSPPGSVIPGKVKWIKPLAEIIAAHEVPTYTASPAYPRDLMGKVQAALKADGPAFMLVDSPCNLGQRYPPNISIVTTELAVKSCFFPLYATYKDEWLLTGESARIAKKPERKIPVEEYLKPQGRFRHLFLPEWKSKLTEIQDIVDDRWNRLVNKSSF